MSVQKASVVAATAVENSGGRVTEADDGFAWSESTNSRSTLVAYLKCHYFLSSSSWHLRYLERLDLCEGEGSATKEISYTSWRNQVEIMRNQSRFPWNQARKSAQPSSPTHFYNVWRHFWGKSREIKEKSGNFVRQNCLLPTPRARVYCVALRNPCFRIPLALIRSVSKGQPWLSSSAPSYVHDNVISG